MLRFIHYFACACLLLTQGCKDSLDPREEREGGKKNVILLRYKPGSESTEQREEGFLDTLKKHYPDVNILSSDQYAGTTPEESLRNATNVLNRHGDKLDGIFAVCEPNANGVLQALENTGLDTEVKFLAFDPSPDLVEGLADGKVHGIVLQDPYSMGMTAVETMVKHLENQKLPEGERTKIDERIATGEFVATKENMNDKDEFGNDIKQLLDPIQFTDDQAADPADKKYEIAVIPKGTTHEFWKSVHAGAEKAARDLGGVDILWNGPLNENDTQQQIKIVRDMISRGVSGICLAPNDSGSLVDAVKEAGSAGIPVVIFDSGLAAEPPVFVSYVATDNYHGGQLAAHTLAKALSVKPKKPADE